ncbi:MAG: NERD domain-containing protein [Gammaproteobacteria bacterium]|nr:NERD domain-containing protein [Gammaproteobacteria bacterium]
MANLIPALNSCKPRMTGGERRFAERLEAKLEDDYLLWYEVAVGPKNLHPDFIVFHPRRGVLVLEVKDWRLDTIQSINRTTATIVTSTGAKTVASPLEQARQYAHEVINLLQKDPVLVANHRDRTRGKLLFPWSYGVVLPNISRRQFESTDLGEVLLPHRVICKDEMYEEVDVEAFQSRLWGMFPWDFGAVLTLPQIDRVRWHLFPEIRIEGPKQGGIFDDDIPDIIRIMDLQQEQLARSLGDGHRVIHGVAGSGKTMILGYRCLHLAKALHKPILVLCYNKTLAARLAEMMEEKGASSQVSIRNFHAWCRDQLVSYHVPLPDTKSSGEFSEQLVERLIGAVDKGQIPRGQYGAVLIDEGHDFQPEWLSLVSQMVDPETNSLLLLYDDAQSIYGGRRRKFSFKSVGVQAQGRTTILRLNYRNTAEVLRVAYEFAKDVLTPEDADEDGVPLILPESAERHGPVPELVRLPSFAREADHLASEFQRLHADGASWSDMAIAYRTRFMGEKIAQRLRAVGIPVAMLTGKASRKGPRPDPDSVKVVTWHSSKGLEFPIVAIPGLGYLPNEKADDTEEVRLAYVAMTRAMDRLILTCHQESPFVERLMAAGTQCTA